MADLTAEEINEGKRILKGPRVVFWISVVIAILGAIGSIVSFFSETFNFIGNWTATGSVWALLGSIFGLILAIIWVILYWAELSGLIKGRPHAVGLGRFLLIWMMIFSFPIGTIIGAIVWKRLSDPAAQKYLNYIK